MSPAETSALMSIPVILISPSSIFFKSPLTMAESEVFANEALTPLSSSIMALTLA